MSRRALRQVTPSRSRTRETTQEESPRKERKTELATLKSEMDSMRAELDSVKDQMKERFTAFEEKIEKKFEEKFDKLSELISGFGNMFKTVQNEHKKFEEKTTEQMDHADTTFEAYKQEQTKETEIYQAKMAKDIEDQLKMAMDIQSANISNQMSALNNENRKNWQEFKRQHDIGTSSKSEVKQLETAVESKNKKVIDDVKDLDNRFREHSVEIETEVKNLNSKMEKNTTQVRNDVNHLKGILQTFQPKIHTTEEQVEMQRAESRDLQQRIEEIEKDTKEKQDDIDDLTDNFNALRHDMSTNKEQTQAELGSVQQNYEEVSKILNKQKTEMQELTERHQRENKSLQELWEERYNEPKQERVEGSSINTLNEDTLIKVFRAMMDAEKEHIKHVKREEDKTQFSKAEIQQTFKEMAQVTKNKAKDDPLTEKKIREIAVKAIAEER
ncbi:hypothetical protein B5S32_g5742 [[Candida] boidinii]|nr:hypothetical protein B5S32_g5742 [[Candida] boidinii]